jgi:predicted dehydrogenase
VKGTFIQNGGMSDVVRWGVLGAGWIASTFCDDLALLPGHEVVAVGARSPGTNAAFAERFRVPHVHDSYEALVADPDVDVVYVATPHPWHHDAALLAIEAGKAVLVEKPFTMDAAQARTLVAAARERGTFLMEAMWTRFLPHMEQVREVLASGRIGDVVGVNADFVEHREVPLDHRLYAPELGGGALLDLGVYPLSFASMVLGTPSHVSAASEPAPTGVDAQTSMLLGYPSGAHGLLSCGFRGSAENRATIVGTHGRIDISGQFWRPTTYAVIDRDGGRTEVDARTEGHGIRFEAAEVGRCVREGLHESPVLPLDETVAVMETLDEVRRQIGLSYPSE